MDAIKNIDELPQILAAENPKWQKIVYEETGVIVLLNRNGGTLLSKCGYIDLDCDVEYSYKNGVDCTDYCEICSIKELTDYIVSMESYKEYLCDISYGKFTKSELFWAIYARIICPMENQRREDGTIYQDWGLFSIGMYKEYVELHMALVDFDSTEFLYHIDEYTELNDILNLLADEMCEITEGIDGVPQYKAIPQIPFYVPVSYESLMTQFSDYGIWSFS